MGIGRWRRWQDRAYGPADESHRSLPMPGWLAAVVAAIRGRRTVLVSLGIVGAIVVLLIGITVSATGTGNEHGRPAFDQVVAEASHAAGGSTAAQSSAAGLSTPSSSSPARAGSPTSPADVPTYYTAPYDPGTPDYGTVPTYPVTTAAGGGGRPGVQSSVAPADPTTAPATHSSTPAPPVSTATPTPTPTDTYVPPPPTDTYVPPPPPPTTATPTPTPSPTKTCKVWLLPGVCLIWN